MNVRALLLVLVVVLAGCTSAGQPDQPAGTVEVTVQNDSGEPVDVTITVTDEDGTVVTEETDRLAGNVGRTFDLAVDDPGTYDLRVDAGHSAGVGRWETETCATQTVRMELTERGTHTTWGCDDADA